MDILLVQKKWGLKKFAPLNEPFDPEKHEALMMAESPDVSDLPNVGVVGLIKGKLELPNGNVRIVVSGKNRVKVLEYVNEIADGDILKAHTMDIEFPKFDA